MSEKDRQSQHSEGGPTAQAQDHSTAHVEQNQYYEHVPPLAVDPHKIVAAREKLSRLPLDEVPPVVQGPPHGSRTPSFGPNAAFVGREGDLKVLAATLKSDSDGERQPIAGVAGLSGIGKTQVAGEFVHRYGQFFEGGVYWLNFSDSDNVGAEIATCGSSGSPELGSDFPRLPLEDQIKRVTAMWQSALPRLLVFDNCEDVKLLAFWDPRPSGCRVLVTSRRKLEDASLGLNFIELDVLSSDQSVDLLRRILDGIPADEWVLEGIAQELGYLPLALDLAGRFLVNFRATDTPRDYLAELRQIDLKQLSYHDSMEDSEGASPTNHELSVARTFELDLRRLDRTDPIDDLALNILSRMARLAPDMPIPRSVLLSSLNLSEGDRKAERDAERAIIKLTQLGLIRSESDVEMHRLVSGVVLGAVQDSQAQSDVDNAVANAVSHYAEAGEYQTTLPLLPHLRFLASGIGDRQDALAGFLCFVLGALLLKLRREEDYEEALRYTKQALSITGAAKGATSIEALRTLVNLGAIQHAMEDIDGALDTYRQALRVSKRVFGSRDAETAYAHNNLGSTLRDKAFEPGQTQYSTGRYLKETYQNYKKALKIREKKCPGHPDLAESLTNMGNLMLDLGRFNETRPYLERSLRIDSAPPVPLDLRGKTLQLLGLLLRDQGKHSEAHSHLSQSYEAYKGAFGPEHPATKEAKELMEQSALPLP